MNKINQIDSEGRKHGMWAKINQIDSEGSSVTYAKNMDDFVSDGNYYLDDLYIQRFYSKWVYEGEKYTMIFCNPGVDGMKWFRVFDNVKKIKNVGE